ncbi:MAG: putative signal transducing protein [Lutibacter sp.]
MKSNSGDLVNVLTTSLYHEIHIAKTLLSSYGIQSFIFDENLMTTIGTAYVEGYKLEVDSADFEKAKEILSSIEDTSI